MTFSYLGKHGRTLAANGQLTVMGELVSSFGHGEQQYRKRKALERDLNAGRLVILSTPKMVLADTAPAAQIANPTTQATVSATGGGASGGNLAAGTYYAAYTWANTWGETTVGTSQSAQFTVSAGNIPRVTIPSLPSGASSAKIYLTDANGATGTTKLYVTGITATTADLSAATYNSTTYTLTADKPSANTTKGPAAQALKSTAGTLGVVDPSWGRYAP